MSIRIYALAKELNIESKNLVELCQKLGMGKCGSALASLTDEEVALVKNHLTQQKAKKTAASAGSNEMARPVPPIHLTSYGKVPNLPARPKKRSDDVSAPSSETTTGNSAEKPLETPAVISAETSVVTPVEMNAEKLSKTSVATSVESPVATPVEKTEEQPLEKSAGKTVVGQEANVGRESVSGLGKPNTASVSSDASVQNKERANEKENLSSTSSTSSSVPGSASSTVSDSSMVSSKVSDGPSATPSVKESPTPSKTKPIINIIKRANAENVSDASGASQTAGKVSEPAVPEGKAVAKPSSRLEESPAHVSGSITSPAFGTVGATEKSTPVSPAETVLSDVAKPSSATRSTKTVAQPSASQSSGELRPAVPTAGFPQSGLVETSVNASPSFKPSVSAAGSDSSAPESSVLPSQPVTPSPLSPVVTTDPSSTVSTPVISSVSSSTVGSDSDVVLPCSAASVETTSPEASAATTPAITPAPVTTSVSSSLEQGVTAGKKSSSRPLASATQKESSTEPIKSKSGSFGNVAGAKADSSAGRITPERLTQTDNVSQSASGAVPSDQESGSSSVDSPSGVKEPQKKDSEPARPKRNGVPVIKVIGHREEPKSNAGSSKDGRDGDKSKSESPRGSEGLYNRLRRDGNHPGPLTMRLAPMPTAKTPTATVAKPKEPAAMKPDIRLSTEVIRATKAGVTPLADHLKRAENQRLEEDRKKAVEEETQKAKKNKKGKSTTETYEDTVVRSKAKGKKPTDVPVSLGGREQRQLKRKRQGSSVSVAPVSGAKKGTGLSDEPLQNQTSTRIKHLHRTGQNTAAPRKNKIVITLPITVRSFAEELGLPAGRILGKLMQMGQPMVITSPLDLETAELLAEEFDIDVEIRAAQTLEEKLLVAADELEDAPEDLKARPPVITFLGHVDHGKTSLLDRIIGINVCSGEKGGITQHIRAYQINKSGNKITFVDTPGHQAFTEMRARGANCTDIAVLVVAADDGVMPQTEEAISHARAAGVPIVVALNKIDIPGVNIPKVMQELASNDLLPSEWGGDVEVVKCSAMTGEGIDSLLDTLLTVAELHEFKANPKRQAMGICVESRLNQEQGAAATVLVQNGTLKVGDIVVCGSSFGRVKAMTDTLQKNKRVQKATPSMPVNLFGLDKAPGAGDKFYVLDSISDAREIAARKAEEEHQKDLIGSESKHVTLENLFDTMGQKNQVQTLNIILRTDVRGSIEAIRTELTKLDNPEVQIRVLQAMVGGITEADVSLADASDAVIIGFNVVPDENARLLAEQKGVQVRRYDIIYKLTDDLRAALEGMLKPEEKETDTGRIAVLRKFVISHVGTIAGCRVLTGSIQRTSRVRIIRDNRIIGDYGIDTLKHEKDDVKEVLQGHECGIKLQNFNDIKEGDLFEAYKIEEVSRKL